MFSSTWSFRHMTFSLVGLFYLATYVSAADVLYCSTLNTAATSRNSSIYQSNGLCMIFCQQTYAFAVLQYDACWCSDYAPQTTTTGCTRNCPGFPEEDCGGIGLYGYIQLQEEPSGTRGALGPSPTTTRQAITTVTESPDPVTTTIVISPPILTFILETSSSLIPSTTKSSDTTTSAPETSSTWTATPIISLVTGAGSVRTVTVIPTQPPASAAANNQNGGGGKGLGTGAIVGLAIGLLALAAIILGLLFLVLRRRRKQRRQADEATAAALSEKASKTSTGQEQAIPSRTMSENSRYVLGTDGRQVVEAWENDAAGSRQSRLIPVDPRLDPFSAVYQRGDNKSRESVNTIRDDHDYSRRVHHGAGPLRAVNPDTTNLDD